MIKNGEIFDFLCEKYPLDSAADFDNPGFLIGDKDDMTEKVIVSLDCDITAVKEAVKTGSKLIITHHPVIFDPLKSVTAGSVVYEAIKNGISVISMHTNLDIAEGGVNDCLCEALGLTDVKPYIAEDGFTLRSGKTDADADSFAKIIKENLGYSVRYTGSGKIEKLLVCSGSGCDYMDEAIKNGFDGLIAADSKQRHFIKAINNGFALFDCGHFASENVVIKPLCRLLSEKFRTAEFIPYSHGLIKFA